MRHNDGFGKLTVYMRPDPSTSYNPKGSVLERITRVLAEAAEEEGIKCFIITTEKDKPETVIGMMSYVPKKKECAITLKSKRNEGHFVFYSDCVEMAEAVVGAFFCHELDMLIEGFTCCKTHGSKATH